MSSLHYLTPILIKEVINLLENDISDIFKKKLEENNRT